MKKLLVSILALCIVCMACVCLAETDAKCAHDFSIEDNKLVKNATCTEDGIMQYGYRCFKCNEFRIEGEEVIPAGHKSDKGTVTTAPKCTEEGEKTYKCTVCGKVLNKEAVAATGHDYYHEGTDGPACLSYTYVETCKVCGDTQTVRKAASAEHKFSDWSVTTAATCTKDGIETRVCKVCGTPETRTIAAPGHKMVEKGNVAPTCIKPGMENVKTCTVCGYTTSVEVPATNVHSGKTKGEVKPDCGNSGYKYFICDGCGKTFTTETIEATGAHEYTYVVIKEPTCTEDGSKQKLCKLCGRYIVDDQSPVAIPALGHTYTKKVVTPTCTEKGYDQYTCDVCGFVAKNNYTDKIDHKYTKNVTKATCTTLGKIDYKCEVCGFEATEDIPMIDHVQIDREPKAATCTEDGYTRGVICKNCGKVFWGTKIDALKHTWGEERVVAPTCTEQGYTVKVCKNCGEAEKSNFVKALGHTEDKGVVTKAATCTAAGVKTYTCTVCKQAVRTEAIAMIPHTYNNGVVTKAPTCTAAGVKTYTCSACKGTKTESIAMVAHTYDKGVVTTAPTCVVPGVKTYTCTACKATKTEAVATVAHQYKTEYVRAATPTQTGLKVDRCKVCGDEINKQTFEYYKMSNNQVITGAGIAVENSAFNAIVVDMTADGTYEYAIIGNNYVVGNIVVTVKDGTIAIESEMSNVYNTNGTTKVYASAEDMAAAKGVEAADEAIAVDSNVAYVVIEMKGDIDTGSVSAYEADAAELDAMKALVG